MKKIKFLVTLLFGSVIGCFSLGFKAEARTPFKPILELERTNYKYINPNGDGDYALINGTWTSIRDFATKYQQVSEGTFDGKTYYYNPNYPTYRWIKDGWTDKAPTIYYCEESPLVNWVDKDYLCNEGDFIVVGQEYGYYIHTEKADIGITTSTPATVSEMNERSKYLDKYAFNSQVLLFDINKEYKADSNNSSIFYYTYEYEVLMQTTLQTYYTPFFKKSLDCFYENMSVGNDGMTCAHSMRIPTPVFQGTNDLEDYGDYVSVPVAHGNHLINTHSLYLGNLIFELETYSSSTEIGNACFASENCISDVIDYNNDAPINCVKYLATDGKVWNYDFGKVLASTVASTGASAGWNGIKKLTEITDKFNYKAVIGKAIASLVINSIKNTSVLSPGEWTDLGNCLALKKSNNRYLRSDHAIYTTSEDILGIDLGYDYNSNSSSGLVFTNDSAPDKATTIILSEPGQKFGVEYTILNSANPYLIHTGCVVGGIHSVEESFTHRITKHCVTPKAMGKYEYGYQQSQCKTKEKMIKDGYLPVGTGFNPAGGNNLSKRFKTVNGESYVQFVIALKIDTDYQYYNRYYFYTIEEIDGVDSDDNKKGRAITSSRRFTRDGGFNSRCS